MSWGLWGIGVPDEPWYRTAAREPHNLLDNHYFPGYTYGSGFDGEIDDDDADQADIESAWVIGEGMDRRKPHMQRGVRYGPSQPDDPGTDTEKWLQNMGHRATQIIHQSPPTEHPLYRGMTVPDSFLQQARETGKLTLPLSSFDLDASTAACYSVPDPYRGYSPRTGNSVMLRMAPGGKAMPLCEGSEHLTHGDFDVTGLRPITDEDREEFGGHDHDDTMVMDIRQRSVPAPVQPRTAHRTAMPHDEDDYDELYHFTDDPHFSGPHPDHEPATISEFSEPGIYLTNNPHNSSVTGGKRPYMATFRVPSWYQDHPGFESDHYGNSSDYFVRPEWFHELKFQGITPTSGSSRHAHRTAMPWYHASPHDLAPGTILTPGGGGHNYDYDNWAPGEGRQDHVWVTDDPDNAEGWAGVAAWDSPHKRGHVYEVEPEDPQEWDGEGGADEGHITPSARIVRKIKTIDHGTHTASRTAMPAPLPKGVTFHYHDIDWLDPNHRPGVCDSCSGDRCHSTELHSGAHPPTIQAVDENGNHVGHLNVGWELPHEEDDPNFDPDSEYANVVDDIHVEPEHRSQNVATGMFDFAKSIFPELQHSRHLSELGKLWSDHEKSRNKEARIAAAYDPFSPVEADDPYGEDYVPAELNEHGHLRIYRGIVIPTGTAVPQENLGKHWSVAQGIAEWFGNPAEHHEYYGENGYVDPKWSGLLYSGWLDPKHPTDTDHHFHDLGGDTHEQELTLYPGTPIHVDQVHHLGPNSSGFRPLLWWKPKHIKAHRTAMPSPPSSSSLPSVGHCGNNWWGEGGCGHLALAFANMYPDMKIGAEYDLRHGGVNHAWVYGPDGRSHDFMGTHDGHPFQMDQNSEVREDVTPEDLAADMGIDYSPDEDHMWDNPEIAQAGHLINRHWHGDDDYGEDSHDGYYDPDRAENRGTHRTAMPRHLATQIHRGMGVPKSFFQDKSGEEIINYLHQVGGLGRSWATEHRNALAIAINKRGGLPDDPHVPVVLSAEWDGAEPDYRGPWAGGEELALKPGTQLRVTSFQVQHEPNGAWKEMLSRPVPGITAHRTAMPWYHVSPHKFEEGDWIFPGGGESPLSDMYEGNDEHAGRSDHVWLEKNMPDIQNWNREISRANAPVDYDDDGNYTHDYDDVPNNYVYEVTPETKPHRWPDQPSAGWVTDSATVNKMVDDAKTVDMKKYLSHVLKVRKMTAAVTVYTQPNCVQCTMTKKQLDRLGIEHSTVDVTADPEAHAYVRGLGYTAAPVVVVNDGEDHWSGFKPERLKALSGE